MASDVIFFKVSYAAVNDEGLNNYALYCYSASEDDKGKDTFLVEFRGKEDPVSTYYMLCDFYMDMTDFKNKHKNCNILEDSYAYSGLQVTDIPERKYTAIFSFWRIEYTDENDEFKTVYAKCKYPKSENLFDNEGCGSSQIIGYDWEKNKWYKLALHSWQDIESGNTFVGYWIQNQETKKWDLVIYYDTNLQNSFLRGGSQFLENYWPDSDELYLREYDLKGMYSRNNDDKSWVSSYKRTISYNYEINRVLGNENTIPAIGCHEFGVNRDEDSGEFFYQRVGGLVENQYEYDADEINHPYKETFEINQPSNPDLGHLDLANLYIKEKDNEYKISWDYGKESNPQLIYDLKILDEKGKIIEEINKSRPEKTSYVYKGDLKEKYKVQLTVEDIFGNKDMLEKEILTQNTEKDEENKEKIKIDKEKIESNKIEENKVNNEKVEVNKTYKKEIDKSNEKKLEVDKVENNEVNKVNDEKVEIGKIDKKEADIDNKVETEIYKYNNVEKPKIKDVTNQNKSVENKNNSSNNYFGKSIVIIILIGIIVIIICISFLCYKKYKKNIK